MFIEFLYELRKRKVPVGAQEAVALARALEKGLHEASLEGFYDVARALLVHREAHLDDFDLAFASYFRGVAVDAKEVAEDILSWLRDPVKRRDLTQEERDALEKLDLDDVLKRLEERLAEQRERHDRGNRWVGTGGTSPFGTGGFHPSGVSIGGGGGGRGAMVSADARKYRPYRSDVMLDIRQIELALRKLRVFQREGEHELDVDETIDATAKNAGELEVVTRPPRRPNTRVVLMMDVGGSMDPYAITMSQLFSAAKRATHFRELRTYYFHNCVYGKVYKTENFLEPVDVREVLAECGPHFKLVMVGDALMAPYELMGSSGIGGDDGKISGLTWLTRLAEHFQRAVWLNPEDFTRYRGTTIDPIRKVFPMFPLTLDGLGESVKELVRGGKQR